MCCRCANATALVVRIRTLTVAPPRDQLFHDGTNKRKLVGSLPSSATVSARLSPNSGWLLFLEELLPSPSYTSPWREGHVSSITQDPVPPRVPCPYYWLYGCTLLETGQTVHVLRHMSSVIWRPSFLAPITARPHSHFPNSNQVFSCKPSLARVWGMAMQQHEAARRGDATAHCATMQQRDKRDDAVTQRRDNTSPCGDNATRRDDMMAARRRGIATQRHTKVLGYWPVTWRNIRLVLVLPFDGTAAMGGGWSLQVVARFM